MQKHEMKHRQSGFTLIEVSLSSLIILIAIAASGSLYLAQTRMHKKLDRSLSMYTIIDQVISEVSGAPADYPMVVKSDSPSEYLVYVKCMSDKSLDVGAKTPPTGDSGMGFRLMPLSSMGGNPKNKALYNSLDYCPVGVELHISFQSLYNVCVTGLHYRRTQ